MNRENILGKNMDYIPNDKKFIYEWQGTCYSHAINWDSFLYG